MLHLLLPVLPQQTSRCKTTINNMLQAMGKWLGCHSWSRPALLLWKTWHWPGPGQAWCCWACSSRHTIPLPSSDYTRDNLYKFKFAVHESWSMRIASVSVATRGRPCYWEGGDEVSWGQILPSDQTAFDLYSDKTTIHTNGCGWRVRNFCKTGESRTCSFC